jgi:1-deoxy-D-xylulose-5-phosphate reductoisomerase
MKQSLTILGSTGSIGQNTLDVVARHPDKFQIFALTANKNHARLLQQCLTYQPQYAVLMDADAAEILQSHLSKTDCPTIVLSADQLTWVATEADTVMAGIVGSAGLLPTLAAVKAGKRVLLANKESLVMAGQLMMETAKTSGATLIPVDSEHNAIFQCLPIGYKTGQRPDNVSKLILTASGGPFRETPLEKLSEISPAQAILHPTWNMGPKISVDCATMLNKGLEVIEAHWLFNMPLSEIDVIVHPQSIIHSIVAFEDGSMLAQLGDHDMRIPITYALSWPERMASGVRPLDLNQLTSLSFQPVDLKRFPCLDLAYQAMHMGAGASIVLNAANEIAVSLFLEGQIKYLDIPNVIRHSLDSMGSPLVQTLESILSIDQQTRACALEVAMC